MKKTNTKKWMIAGGGGLVLVAVLLIALFQWPANQFTLDVNPSLEITTNRMEQVIDVEALNADGREFLEGYERPGRNLEVVINDLVDRMILTGHISGGQDNIVMITVDSDELDSAYVEKVNEAIAAFLQNKQLEYRILNQGLTAMDNEDNGEYEQVSRGRLTLIQKLMQEDAALTVEELQEISLKDLLAIAEELNISPNELFARTINNHVNGNNEGTSEDQESTTPASGDDEGVIGWKEAMEIALDEVGGGVVVEFDYDRSDREYEFEIMYNGYEYEVEIHATSGDILDFEQERDSEADAYVAAMEDAISWEEAVAIALGEAGGGMVVEFEFELDDREMEIEIKYDGYEYDIDLDAYTGEILKIEWERDDDYHSGDPSDNDGNLIGWKQATIIALDEVGGGMVVEFDYDISDREYEVEIMYNGYEYEVEIHAYSGDILDFEQERDSKADAYVAEMDKVIGWDRAIEDAKAHVGGGMVVEFEFDLDDREYEIEIKYDGYEYEIEMDAYTGEILKVEREIDEDYRGNPGADNNNQTGTDDNETGNTGNTGNTGSERTVIGRDRAIEIAKGETGGGTVVEFEYDRSDGEYEIEILHNGFEYEFEIDAYTGRILKMERERDDDARDHNTGNTGSERTVIGRDRAIAIAKERVGGGTVVEFEYDRDDGEYEIEIKHNGYEYEFEIDAYTGQILDFEQERDDDYQGSTGSGAAVIGREKAIAIAMERVGGGIVVEFEYDRDDGEYEIEIKYDGKEYEIEIDAYTGDILDFEIDD